jgi:hypothetical protein
MSESERIKQSFNPALLSTPASDFLKMFGKNEYTT